MIKKLKIFWAVIPKNLIVFLGISLFFKLAANGNKVAEIYSIAFQNVFFVFLFYYIGIIFHEFGHILFAKLFGAKPRSIIFGYGHSVANFKIGNLKIYIKKMMHRGGLAYATFPKEKQSRIGYFFYCAGGIIVNLLFVVVFLLIEKFDLSFLFSSTISGISEAVIIANSFLVLFNLIPYNTTNQGISIETDGKQMYNSFKKNKNKLFDDTQTEMFDAYELFEQKKYDEAIQIYQNIIEIKPNDLLILHNLGVMHYIKGEFDIAISFYNKIDNAIKNGQPFNNKVFFYYNFAWALYLQGNHELALEYSYQAYLIAAQSYYVKLIRGGMLIENNEIDKGISILKEIIDFKFEEFTYQASVFLMLAYHLKGDNKTMLKYKDYVKKQQVTNASTAVFLNKIMKRISEN
ncbi:MAG: tetratricopeptide repeat protein [Bacteroidales bacterium]|nr:tetratricopeptide repeat protein [Bacteroidales bacterium]